MIVSITYKGLHVHGRRSKQKRELIEREVPTIVDEDTWGRAQETLKDNFLLNPRTAKRRYLLRGLMKCGACGKTYIGTYHRNKKVGAKYYYVCNGKHNRRSVSALQGEVCSAKNVPGDIEDIVWADIEGFVRNPGPVLDQLLDQRRNDSQQADALLEEAKHYERDATEKERESDRILGLYRRDLINDEQVERQMEEINSEKLELRKRADQLRQRAKAVDGAARQIEAAEDLLRQLNKRLDEPLTCETKRAVVEKLVNSIQVDTVEEDGKKQAKVTVCYCFLPTETCTGTGSWSD